MRRQRSDFEWEATESGWRCGRYAVALVRPGSWTLEVDGREISTHARASDAGAAAAIRDRLSRRRRKVSWNLAAIVVAAVAMIAAQAGRTVPNVRYEPAREFVLDLEAAYRAVEAGQVEIDAFDEYSGGSFVSALPIDLGEGLRPEPRAYVALVGIHGGECYAVRWTPGGAVFTGVLAADLPCEPDPRLIQSELFTRGASQSPNAAAFSWAEVLPPEGFQARWFVPLLLAMLYVMLQACIGIALALMKPPTRRIPPLSIGVSGLEVPHRAAPS